MNNNDKPFTGCSSRAGRVSDSVTRQIASTLLSERGYQLG